MKVHYSFDKLHEVKNPVVTTGSFDGVHVGHQVIISRLKKLARDIDGESVLITFHPHPRRVLYPDTAGKDMLLICSQEEKLELLEKTGLDHLVIINFNHQFAQITSHEFVEEILVERLRAKIIVVGFNHHFGHNREGDFEYLYKLSKLHQFEVEEIPEQDIHNESVSSTKIRKALLEGNIQRANAYLDHLYIIKGKGRFEGDISRKLEKNVFCLKIDEYVKLVPAEGVYAVSISDGVKLFKGLFSVVNWKIENNYLSHEIKLEFIPLENDVHPDNKKLTVYFQKRIRNSSNGQSIPFMKKQLEKDIKIIDELIF